MKSNPPSSFPAAKPAKHARELLVHALGRLQTDEVPEPVNQAIEEIAAASNALYVVENEADTAQASASGVRIAIEHLGKGLSKLQAVPKQYEALIVATETIARTLALLYPIGRAQQRQRRQAVMVDGETPSETEPLAPGIPPAPEPLGRPRKKTPVYEGDEQRISVGPRVFIEADIGLMSDSHFYTGLSQDISTGGLFVATYQPKPPGTEISIYLVLPLDGHVVEAMGVVRWTRDHGGDAPPGMGIAFKDLRPEDLQAITQFCEHRSPMYHDSAD